MPEINGCYRASLHDSRRFERDREMCRPLGDLCEGTEL